MRPLNEYPKEELEVLLDAVNWAILVSRKSHEYKALLKFKGLLSEAISDQEFEEKQLPFNEPSK